MEHITWCERTEGGPTVGGGDRVIGGADQLPALHGGQIPGRPLPGQAGALHAAQSLPGPHTLTDGDPLDGLPAVLAEHRSTSDEALTVAAGTEPVDVPWGGGAEHEGFGAVGPDDP